MTFFPDGSASSQSPTDEDDDQAGEQFVIRRKANAMIKKAFDENGIQFALPRVHIASSGTGTDIAAAAAAASQALKSSHAEPH